jgi:16S rRNA (cytidine1402-2'-O)-methyltransferase
MVFYESPYRLVKTLGQFIEHFGPDRMCSVAREISKVHEEHRRGTLAEVEGWFREHEPKGEIVIVVAGNKNKLKHEGEKGCGEGGKDFVTK